MIERITVYAALILASFEDLRIREVPFLLSHATIILGVAFAALRSLQTGVLAHVAHSVLGGIIAYTLGYLLYISGQWGGGDVKLFTGIATFIGFNPELPVSFITYVFLVFLTGSIYGLVWSLYNVVVNADDVIPELPHPSIVHVGLTGGAALTVLTSYMVITSPSPTAGLIGSFTLLFIASIVLYVFHHARHIITTVDKETDELVPGDWLAERVETSQGTISSRNTGLSVQDIQALRDSTTEAVTVRVGLPFVPSFLFAYLCYDFLSFDIIIQSLV